MTTERAPRGLHRLARLYGVQTRYRDVFGRPQRAAPEALLAVLKALGAPLETLRDVPAALRAYDEAHWARLCEPVAVAWAGRAPVLELRLPGSSLEGRAAFRLDLETGERRRGEFDPARLATAGAADIEGARYLAKKLELRGDLPFGVHRLSIEVGRATGETWIVSAPPRAPSGDEDARIWGVFLPLYALRSKGWGLGDFTDLHDLLEWITGLGGSLIGTPPLLAAFLDEPCEPSPYLPASRLFWNEVYLDVTRIPELECSPAARSLVESSGLRADLERLRSSDLVEYREVMRRKRAVLEELARSFFANGGERRRAFEQYARESRALDDYARFRATCEARHAPWPSWPERLRDGHLRTGDYSEDARRYHMYVQWLADEQIREVCGPARAAAAGLYLDLPLGAHPDGYDVWRERAIFARGASAGAPPDTFFTKGQDWGFPPLHPERIREDGYRYYAACLRHSLRFARILRVDHVMGWHRLFWVPRGSDAKDGLYVRYHADEFYAMAALESWRRGALIAGEDLGTVPSYVRSAMRRHGLLRMYVAQYAALADPRRALGSIAHDAVASLNSHDMPTFAAFWEGLDIDDRIALGLLDERGAQVERASREALRRAIIAFLRRAGHLPPDEAPTAPAVACAALAHLAAGRTRVVIATLEDLWGETRPQNVPGTGHERPNWRRKAQHAFEAFSRMPQVTEALHAIDRNRKQRTARR